jgi:hypothetical protein
MSLFFGFLPAVAAHEIGYLSSPFVPFGIKLMFLASTFRFFGNRQRDYFIILFREDAPFTVYTSRFCRLLFSFPAQL